MNAFTLIEVSVVFIIIAILASIAIPSLTSVLKRAKKVQASNDLAQIVTAVSAYYTEYGKYPIDPALGTNDITYSVSPLVNDKLIDVLRNNTASTTNGALVTQLNPRQIVYLNVPPVKDAAKPTLGISSGTGATLPPVGTWCDPWGNPYYVRIDGNYDNALSNPYTGTVHGPALLSFGVIGWSIGEDKAADSATRIGDDMFSWR